MKHENKQENIPRHSIRVIADHLSNHDLTRHSSQLTLTHSSLTTGNFRRNGLITVFIVPVEFRAFENPFAANSGPVMPV